VRDMGRREQVAMGYEGVGGRVREILDRPATESI
jgi:hypothetical protein